MKDVHINTSQNVVIDYNLADIGNRVLAKLLDNLFLIAYGVIFYFIIWGILINSDGFLDPLIYDDWIWIIPFFIIAAPVVFYSLWAPYFMQGQTFGKKIMKIKIVKADGSEASFGTYFVRWLLGFIDSLFYNMVGLITMASTQRRQRVADLIAGTVVISTKQTFHVDQTILSEIEENYQPKFTQVLQLSDRDLQIIKTALERARATVDIDLTRKLRNKIESVIHEYKPELTDIEYVETVIKDYQYFSQQ
ncbi:MAG: RDD family protein [Flavobacteriaceae bacterium]|jgi:uncharacterized RDD family membrane protein YckC|nr:RDD family protein [Flavobacteriaceae bacterium]